MAVQQTKIVKLRHNHAAWVAHCRAQQTAWDKHREDDDGMSHGIIPFGTVSQWASIEDHRLKAALAAPVPARITGWDESGVGLALTCPYCQKEHQHIVVPDAWAPEELLMGSCGKGAYQVSISPANY